MFSSFKLIIALKRPADYLLLGPKPLLLDRSVRRLRAMSFWLILIIFRGFYSFFLSSVVALFFNWTLVWLCIFHYAWKGLLNLDEPEELCWLVELWLGLLTILPDESSFKREFKLRLNVPPAVTLF